MLPFGDFNNILLVDSLLSTTMNCTTTIFSFTEKIMETREFKTLSKARDGKFIYSFDFCSSYWTAFLNGLKLFSGEQSKRALESITMFQVLFLIGF